MKTTFFTAFLWLVCCSFVLAQHTCSTEKPDSAIVVQLPWYNNNQYLLDLVDSIDAANATGPLYQQGQGILPNEVGGLAEAIFQVPIRYFIYRNDDGTDPALSNEAEAERFTNEANRYLRENPLGNTQIMLYSNCDETEWIDNTELNDNVTEANREARRRATSSPFALTAHFSTRLASDDPATITLGEAGFPWQRDRYTFFIGTAGEFRDVVNFPGNFEANSTTFLHEIGHCLGLFHTQENARGLTGRNAVAEPCYQEYVSRSARIWGCVNTFGLRRAEVNGDLLRDTDANPGLRGGTVDTFSANCDARFTTSTNRLFLRDRSANGGEEWFSNGRDNALRNFMSSLLWFRCRTEFTPMQRGVMHEFLRRHLRGSRLGWVDHAEAFYRNNTIDVFENDNFFQTATPVDPLDGERQHHTFHRTPWSWDPESSNPGIIYSSCDTDWLSFSVPSTQEVFIHTEEVVGEDRPNIRLRLFRDDGALGLTLVEEVNDPTSEFSTIQRFLTGGDYFVEVINDEGGNWPSHYIITISYDQAGGLGGSGGTPTLTGATQGPNGWIACSGGQLGLGNIPQGCSVT